MNSDLIGICLDVQVITCGLDVSGEWMIQSFGLVWEAYSVKLVFHVFLGNISDQV